MKNNDYDFDLIISSEDLKANRERALLNGKKTKKRRRLKKWVKVALLMLLGAVIGIAIYQLFTLTSTHSTPVGDYTCKGGIIKICTGSKEVANYLGA